LAVCVLALDASPLVSVAALVAVLRRLAVVGHRERDRVQPVTPRRCRLQPTTMQYGTE